MTFAAVLLVLAPLQAPIDTAHAALVGTWEGTVALDSGSVETDAAIRLVIAADGTVTGTVGDATIRNARIGRNPSLLARLFGLGTTWQLYGELAGPLRAADALRRDRVTMPLDLVDGELRGDFNASGGGRLLSVRARLRRP